MTTRQRCRVIWSAEDNEYAGLCAAFPSLSWLEPTPNAALAGIRRLVLRELNDQQAGSEPNRPPPP